MLQRHPLDILFVDDNPINRAVGLKVRFEQGEYTRRTADVITYCTRFSRNSATTSWPLLRMVRKL